MFDRSCLTPARFEFVIISDTHFILDPEPYAVEFESVREWWGRAGWAVKLAAALASDFVVHLGDLAEENPGRPDYLEVRDRARAQMRGDGIDPYWVAGNMDIGDKPDAAMFTKWVSAETLSVWEQRFSRSWYSFDRHGLHFVVLNSQIINGPLQQAVEQQSWLEDDLGVHDGERIVLFLHMPPFFVDEDEPDKGFYNTLDEPGRSWLTSLLRRHRAELVFAGHTHFRAFNRIADGRFYVAPSTTTSRAGFSEAFSVAPAPEQGRNDKPKLGFFLVRVHETGSQVHMIRTGGDTGPREDEAGWQRLLTRTSPELERSPIGVNLTTALAYQSAGAVAWPSLLRQRARDDHPLLSCLELGARHVRVPASDLDDGLQRERLRLLRDEGVEVAVFWLWSEGLELIGRFHEHADRFDTVELQTPGALWPAADCARELARCARYGKPVTLTPVSTQARTGGKYHPRSRLGFRLDELPELDRRLTDLGVRLDRVVLHIDPATGIWETLCALTTMEPLASVAGFDIVASLAAADADSHTHRAAEAAFAGAIHPACRLFLDPYVDLDRTNDAVDGLLDRLSNPRPAFHAVRALNTILFSEPAELAPCASTAAPDRVLGLAGECQRLWLVLPQAGGIDAGSLAGLELEGRASVYRLDRALSRRDVSGEDELQQLLTGARGAHLIHSTTR